MARVWSRRDLEDRVNVLRERYDGEEFAGAIAQFSDELDHEEQADLREILLERSRAQALRDAPPVEHRGWFRRTFDRLERQPPR
jgi:hypothetical protein